ncbi:MAG: hypothetical protein OHK0013_29920 [Sandaracinaceae bacterium]
MNRGVSLSVVLAMMGCSGRAAQPIVVDREALVGSREERIEEVVEEDEAWEPASLAAPSELHNLIAVQPVEGPGPGQDAMRALWTCERPVRGNLRVELGGVLTTIHSWRPASGRRGRDPDAGHGGSDRDLGDGGSDPPALS